MKTHAVGDVVTFPEKDETDHYEFHLHGQSFTVLEVEDVPEELIEYNPMTQEGGVGHHQWVTIDAPSLMNDGSTGRTFSGAWFEKKLTRK
jgi:hypothetical protein